MQVPVLMRTSGEKLLEPGVGLKTVKAKQQGDRAVEYWSPNYLGRVYRTETESGEVDNHLRPHWREIVSNVVYVESAHQFIITVKQLVSLLLLRRRI